MIRIGKANGQDGRGEDDLSRKIDDCKIVIVVHSVVQRMIEPQDWPDCRFTIVHRGIMIPKSDSEQIHGKFTVGCGEHGFRTQQGTATEGKGSN